MAERRANDAKLAEAREAAARIETQRKAQEAETARSEEAEASEVARRHAADAIAQRRAMYHSLYNADMRLAALDSDRGNASRLIRTLSNHWPDDGREDLRSWEWYYLLAGAHQEAATLYGHEGSVSSVAWSPNGHYFATTSYDGWAKIWDAKTFRPVRAFCADASFKRGLAWSPDSLRLAWGSTSRVVRIWNSQTNQVQTLQGHGASLVRLAWSPDGKWLASCSLDKSLKIWDPKSGDCIHTLVRHSHHVRDVCWSPDNQLLASVGRNDGLKVWHANTGQLIKEATEPRKLNSIAWSPDGHQLAVGTQASVLTLFDTRTWEQHFDVKAHAGTITDLEWFKDGPVLVSAGTDGLIKFWDSSGKNTRTLNGHRGQIFSISWDSNSARLLSGDTDGEVRIWDVSDADNSFIVQHGQRLRAVSWTETGQLVCVGQDGSRQERDARTGELTHTSSASSKGGVAWSTDGRFVARVVVSDGRRVLMIDDTQAAAQVASFDWKAGNGVPQESWALN